VIFFGKDSDSLFLAMAYFTVTIKPDNRLYVDSYLAKAEILVAGHTDEILDTLGKKETWRGDIVKTIKSLIAIVAKAHPFEVGGNIQVVKFTKKNGLRWINGKKPPCVE
jgi:hypothetical protein